MELFDYCERTSDQLWAEPLNALSNIAFLICALFAFRLACRLQVRDWLMDLLIWLVVAMAVGSFLWHTTASLWAELTDVAPILLFLLSYCWMYSRREVGLSRSQSIVAVIGVLAFAVVAGIVPRVLYGSLGFTPALFTLGFLAVYHAYNRKRKRWALIGATLVLSLSLVLRALDFQLCESFPYGTHWLWHISNAFMLYILLYAILHNWWPNKRWPKPAAIK